jgi:hypothetical protein
VNNLTGDVTGAPNATVVSRLQGFGVANTAPTLGQVLIWNGAAWTPTNVPAPTTGNLTLANAALGSVTGGTNAVLGAGTSITILNTAAQWNANQLQGLAVVNTAPTNGQVLKWNNGTSQWEPSNDLGTTYTADTGLTLTGTTYSVNNLAGDVTGAPGTNSVVRLQNRNLAATAPTNGQVLKWNNGTSQWEPSNDLGTTYTGTLPIA